MLKRLKTAVQHQQEKTAAPVSESGNDKESQNFYEGLVCPECHKTFDKIDLLQKHYEQLHGVPTSVENGGEGQSNIGNVSVDQGTTNANLNADADASVNRPLEKSVSNLSSFVCPQCFQELPSADSLETHFLAMHIHDNPNNREVDVLSMRQEMNDLRAALKEEKRYAAELKKEVEKLHGLVENNAAANAIASKPAGAENESMYYLQQIQMLEAEKALVTTKMLELEKLLAEATRANESVVREKDRVLEKSLHIAQEHASVRSLYDEEVSRSAAREARIEQLKESVRELESQLSQRPSDDDVAVLRKELVHAQMLMNDMAQEKERETNESVVRCGQLEKKCIEQEEKMMSLLTQLKDVTEEKEDMSRIVAGELEMGKTKRLELEAEVARLEKTISEQKDAIAKSHDNTTALNAQLEELKTASELLKAELSTATEKSSSLRLGLEQKNSEILESARRLGDFETKVKRLTTEREEILKSVEMDNSAQTALAQLTAENTQLANDLRDLEMQFAAFRNESIVESGRQRSELAEKCMLLADLQNQLSAFEEEQSVTVQKASTFSAENDQLKSEVEEKSDLIVSLQTRIDEMQERLKESKKFETSAHESIIKMTKLREDFETSERRWEEERSSLMSAMDDLKQKLASTETQLKDSSAGKDAVTQELKAMTEKCERGADRISVLESEKAAVIRLHDEDALLRGEEKLYLANKLDDMSSIAEAEKARARSLEDALNELKAEIDQLKVANGTLVSEKAATAGELGEWKEKAAKLVSDEADLRNQLMEKIKEINNLSSEKQSVSMAKDELADALKATEMQAADLRAQLTKVEDILRSTREETRAIFLEKQEQLEKLSDDLEQANLEKRAIEESGSAEIESLKRERHSLQDQVDQLTKRCEERDCVYEDVLASRLQLEESLAKITTEKEEEVAEKEKKINALLTERDMRLNEIREAQAELEQSRAEAQSALSDLESKRLQDREATSIRLSEMEKELDQAKAENRRIHEEYTSKETDFDQQLRSLTDALSDMRTQLASRVSQLETESSENSALESRIRDLERQISELQEEKRILLERCVMNEKDIEEEKDNCKELKRRLDDAISAMHELGREHQSFQIDINRHYSRKWADDSDVHNCTKCGKQFTVTVRKHHCRNCGLVFCADCSSKTSLVAVSKKPARVCDTCYNELQSR